ncbi:MAG: ribosome small subunit-dependent GTPase A [Bryobacteraceae bacterium]|nr:ribosome small subunit-dependent GTPase A [Bryobacteraceae bacterium]
MHRISNNTARVFSASHGLFGLLTGAGEATVSLAGSFRHRAGTAADLPVVGDYVQLDDNGLIGSVLPRRTKFSRRAAGTRDEEQVLAANVDLALLVCGLDGDFNLRRLERYLVLAHQSGADPVIVLNKADLDPASLPLRVAEARGVASGAPVVTTSTMRDGGVGAVEALLEPGVTAVLLGSSGAGKSSITNALLGGQHLRTQAVREHDSRGRHTTTHRELVQLPGKAWIIDTPGLREIQLWASEDTVRQVFDDVEELARGCRFRDCKHSGEPGCAVAAAIAAGELDEGRLESRNKLGGEARTMTKAKLKQISRDIRAHYRVTGKK